MSMDVFEALQKRRSVRSYQTKPVPKELIEKLLDAARISPSAKNLQPWHFIVVTETKTRNALSKGMFAHFVKDAPVVIALCGDEQASPDWYMVDVSLAGENMVLAATAEGLGTCWVGSFDEADVKTVLKLPVHFRVIALLAVGYPKEKLDLTAKLNHLIRRRKTLPDIVSWEIYGKQPPTEEAT